MTDESAVQFATRSRIHMGLPVKDLQQSIRFYQTLLGRPPTKVRPQYAKFEIADPPVNLSLNEASGPTGPIHPVTHFGIQVKSTAAVNAVATRMADAGFSIEREDQVTCCYGVQNKIWAADPDGNKWETYVLLDDQAQQQRSSQTSCCPGLPAVIDAVQRGDLAGARDAFQSAGGTSMCGCLAPSAAI